jgi:uncharacterized protein involved in exopolysaccharide biosynthesis
VVVFGSRPVYRAEARLRIANPPPSAGVSPTSGVLSFLQPGGDPFANDLEILSSRTLAESVVRDVALSVRLQAPRGWHRDSVFLSLAVADSTLDATYDITWDPPGTVRVERTAPTDSLIGSFAVGQAARFGGVSATFRPPPAGGPVSVRLKTLPRDEAVRQESDRVTVERTRREANVADISYAHDDPAVALEVVQAVVRHFLLMRTGLFQRESGETVDSLRAVALKTQAELRVAEEEFEAIQRTTGLVAPDAQAEALIGRFEAVYRAWLEARAQRAALETQVARADSAGSRVQAWTTLVASPAFLENETVGGLLTRLTTLEEARAEAASRRNAETREVRTIEERIDQLDEALRAMVTEVRAGLDESIIELGARLRDLELELSGIPSQVVELERRRREMRILGEVLVLTEQRLRQEELREALSFSTVQVIDEPGLRYKPVWPRKKLALAVGLLLATGGGVLAMALVERADATVRQGADVRRVTGAPVLATPLGRGARVDLDAAGAEAIRAAAGPRARLVVCARAEREGPALSAALAAFDPDGPSPEAVAVTNLDAARRAAAGGATGVLVVRAGATPLRELARSAGLLREAGAHVAGTVVVCRNERDRRELWG